MRATSHGEGGDALILGGGRAPEPLLDSVRRRCRDGDEPLISRAVPSRAADVDLPEQATGSTRLRDRSTGLSLAFTLLDAAPRARSEVDQVTVFERGGPEASHVFMRRTDVIGGGT